MHIFVRFLTGVIGTFEVESFDTVKDVKIMIMDKDGIPIEMQRLMFSGKQLEDGQSLADCGVQQESNLYMVVRDCGKW